ncbi:MAG: hypothetical protein Q7S32_00395 [bacterium]|nr:hypothetical protein [bacterium]
MQGSKTILVIGTGTIGYELIRRLAWAANYSDHPYFDWKEIIFHKNQPLQANLPRIKRLLQQGDAVAKISLAVDADKRKEFEALGYTPTYTLDEALGKADLVFDATGKGLANKHHYLQYQDKVFVGQGSDFKKDKKFGLLLVGGINDNQVHFQLLQGERFFVVGSCNAHMLGRGMRVISSVFGSPFGGDISVEATILRRSDDLNKRMIATSFSFSAPDPKYLREGTYHAHNVIEAFNSIGIGDLDFRTKSGKLMDPYMHVVFWRVEVTRVDWADKWFDDTFENTFREQLVNDPWCSLTWENYANVVFTDLRHRQGPKAIRWLEPDRGFMQAVFYLPSLQVIKKKKRIVVEFQTFTPQDANVIWSNLEMAAMVRVRENFDPKVFLELTRPMLEPKEI